MQRPERLLSITLLLAALLLFATFHFLPVVDQDYPEPGWRIWVELWEIFRNPKELADPSTALGVSSFLMFALLIVVSPFLGAVWKKSRPARAFATTFSGLAAGGFWVMILLDGELHELTMGGWCLMFAPIVNFVGLLLASSNAPPSRGIRRES